MHIGLSLNRDFNSTLSHAKRNKQTLLYPHSITVVGSEIDCLLFELNIGKAD
jgi:hypothetical protein